MQRGDGSQGGEHFYDAGLVLKHWASEIEARRRAVGRNNDVLLRRRKEIMTDSSASAIDDQMYAMARRSQTVSDFFRKGGSGSQTTPGPLTQPAASTAVPSFSPLPTSASLTFTPSLSTQLTPTQEPLQLLLNPTQSGYTPQPVLQTAGAVQVQPGLQRYKPRNRFTRPYQIYGIQPTYAPGTAPALLAQPQVWNPQPWQPGGGRGYAGWNQGGRGGGGSYYRSRGRGRGRGAYYPNQYALAGVTAAGGIAANPTAVPPQ
jgi:hypothetical protein